MTQSINNGFVFFWLGLTCFVPPIQADEPTKPNVVFILADDLGFGDLGCFGQKKILTPNLDRMAKEGMRLTQCYAGSTVCAPSRCALMTGFHTGHCRVRGNGGGSVPNGNVALKPSDLCVAEVFKTQGYKTALIGKWGLGEEGSEGIPTKKGFDYFFGYLNQNHAHNYYPSFLYRNESKVLIPENVQRVGVPGVAEKRIVYAPDRLLSEAEQFIEENKKRPFYLFFSTIVPHANNERQRAERDGNEVPSDVPYSNESWPQSEKNKAAMISRLDKDVGTILEKLKLAGVAEQTLVIFTSDNGPHRESGNDPDFFKSSGPFRGIKRSLTDGGIRIPTIARWPGRIQPGTISEHICAFWDFLPTIIELTGAEPVTGLDGISILPTLTNKGNQKTHDYLYWEFHEVGFQQALRIGDWKAIRSGPKQPVQLYNLKTDLTESADVSDRYPEIVTNAKELFIKARTDSAEFPIRIPK